LKIQPDLKSRIPVGILYVLIIASACLGGKVSTLLLIGVFYVFSLYEYVQGTSQTSASRIYSLGISLIFTGLTFWIIQHSHELGILSILTSVLLSLGVLFLILRKTSILSEMSVITSSWMYICLPFTAALTFVNIYPQAPLVVLGVFVILWLNDAGAYFVGKAIGKRKLFASVSPNKSWEGSIGGGIVGTIVAIAVAKWIGVYDLSHWLILSLIIWGTGSYGDLIESSWKRSLGIKDSGTIMKGHGGFLDRLDSFI